MTFSHCLLAMVLGTTLSLANAAPPIKQEDVSQKQQDSNNEARAEPQSSGFPSSESKSTAFVYATCEETHKPNGKVEEIYWTQGDDNQRVTTNEVKHYVDLNLVVRTTGYARGDCIKVQLSSNEGDIAVGISKIILLDRVDEHGAIYFKQPLKNFTLIIQ